LEKEKVWNVYNATPNFQFWLTFLPCVFFADKDRFVLEEDASITGLIL
jgi:hypothetical protein